MKINQTNNNRGDVNNTAIKRKLDRTSILTSIDRPTVEVEIEEWGGSVWVKKMSGTERDAFEIGNSRDDFKNVRARAAVLCVCDEQGNPIFKQSDIDALGAKSASALDKIWEASVKINKFTPEDVRQIEGNS